MPLDDETAKKVIRQVEFYFSDSNLPRDKFMMKTISASDDGMVSLALICSLFRMRGHLRLGDVKPEDVTKDTIQAVAETLRTSTFLKVSEDGMNVGRVTELAKPEEIIRQSDDRTVAASPLEYDVKLEHVKSYFSQYAKNLMQKEPRKRRWLLKLDPQLGSNRKEKTNTKSEYDYPKGLIVAFTLKSLSTEDSAKQQSSDEQTSMNIGISMDVKDSTNCAENENAEKCEEKDGNIRTEDTDKSMDKERPKIAAFWNNKDVVLREDLRKNFQKFGTVKFIDFKIGLDSGFIRFEEAEAAQSAWAAAVLAEKNGLIVKNFIAILDPVTGDAEKDYWNALRSGQQEKQRDRVRGGRHYRGGGRHSDRKHYRGRDDQPRRENKVQKVEAA